MEYLQYVFSFSIHWHTLFIRVSQVGFEIFIYRPMKLIGCKLLKKTKGKWSRIRRKAFLYITFASCQVIYICVYLQIFHKEEKRFQRRAKNEAEEYAEEKKKKRERVKKYMNPLQVHQCFQFTFSLERTLYVIPFSTQSRNHRFSRIYISFYPRIFVHIVSQGRKFIRAVFILELLWIRIDRSQKRDEGKLVCVFFPLYFSYSFLFTCRLKFFDFHHYGYKYELWPIFLDNKTFAIGNQISSIFSYANNYELMVNPIFPRSPNQFFFIYDSWRT